MAANSAKFDEQGFLIDFYKEFVKLNKSSQYKNFCQLTGDPSFMINKIFANHIDDVLFKMTPLQISALVPKIRVYKVVYDTVQDQNGVNVKQNPREVEFPFKNHFDIQGLLSSNAKRGVDVGLMSFSWDDAGTNEVESGVLFNANLKIYLQNVEAFNKDRGGIKFADLLIVSGKNNLQTGEEREEEVYEDANYRIKVVAGWAVPDASNKLFSRKERRAIDKLQIPLFVTSTTHEIEFREDGSVILNLDYVAAIDGRMRHKDCDILYVEDGGKAEATDRLLKGAVEQAKKDVSSASSKKKAQEEIQKKLDKGYVLSINDVEVDPTAAELLTQKRVEKAEEELKIADEVLREAEQRYEKFVFSQRSKAYSRIITKLQQKGRLFQFYLSQDEISDWISSLDRFNSEDDKEVRQRKVIQNRINQKASIIKSVAQRGGKVFASSFINEGLNSLQAELLKTNNPEDRKNLITKFASSEDNKPVTENKNIHFFFLGDLVDAALEIIYNPEEMNNDSQKNKSKKNIEGKIGRVKPNKNNFNFILGPVELIDYDEDNKLRHVSIPMADIPVSLNLFNLWFAETIIKPLKSSYSLKAFFCDLLSRLMNNALSPIGYGPVGQFNNTNFGVSIFNAPLSEEQKDKGPFPPGSIMRIDDAKTKFPTYDKTFRNIRNLKQYFMLYHRGITNRDLAGSYNQDLNNGIHHFVVGSQAGIIKSINFNVDKIPGRREAQIAKSKELSERNFMYANVYNATVKMVGNPLFKPGMFFYINPIGLGFSKKSDAARIGIGGYYVATKVSCKTDADSFETTIEGSFQVAGTPSNKRIETFESKVATDNKDAFELVVDGTTLAQTSGIKKINDKYTETATGQKVRIGPLNVIVKTKPKSQRSLSIKEKTDF